MQVEGEAARVAQKKLPSLLTHFADLLVKIRPRLDTIAEGAEVRKWGCQEYSAFAVSV